MLFILSFCALSEFQPYQNPQCIAENKCPDSIDKELLSISDNQFCGCQYPKSTVKISESITKIPKYAFYGSKIEKIMLHSNIQIIDEGAFAECSIEINITEATNLKIIGNGSFYHAKKISTLFLPKNIITIGSYAFANITSLKKAQIHAKYIESRAFLGCYEMNVDLIDIFGSGFIKNDAFHDCFQLKGMLRIQDPIDKNSENELILSSIGMSAFQNSGIKSLSLPPLKVIGPFCFFNCIQLLSCPILNVEKIDDYAFKDNPRLAIYKITTKFIGKKAFKRCSNLNPKIKLHKDGTIDKTSFNNCDKFNHHFLSINKKDDTSKISLLESGSCGPDLQYSIDLNLESLTITGSGNIQSEYPWRNYSTVISSIDIESDTEIIGYGAFENFIKLETVYMSNSVINIQPRAFCNCVKLNTVYFGSGVAYFSDFCFTNCSCLEILNFPQTVEIIGYAAFANCTSLKGPIDIPANITKIDKYAFSNSNVNTFIYCGNNIPTLNTCQTESLGFFENGTFPESRRVFVLNTNFGAYFCGAKTYLFDGSYTPSNTPDYMTSDNDIYTHIICTLHVESYTLEKTLKNKYKCLNYLKPRNIIVVFYTLDIQYNMRVIDNVFISPLYDVTITLYQRSINLHSSGYSNTIKTYYDILDIKHIGSGTLKFLFTTDYSITTFELNNTFNLQDKLYLIVPNYINSVLLGSIYFDKNGSLKVQTTNQRNVELYVKNISLLKKSQALISNIQILDTFTIYQTGHAKLQNVTFNDASIEYKIYSYDSYYKQLNPFDIIDFETFPKLFILSNRGNRTFNNPLINTDYTLISGFSNKYICENWLNSIDFGNTRFNEKKCNNNQIIIKASVNKQKKITNNDKIGIIIGCIGFVVLVGLITFNILRFNKRSKADKSVSSSP